MALRIKKNYKLPDGTFVEVEGTEAEIEAFEKKQQKQKSQLEKEQAEQKKRTILYGKDLEDIRKIVQEEIAKQPHQHHHYPWNGYWYPYYPAIYTSAPTWTVSTGTFTVSEDSSINTSGNYYTASNVTATTTAGQLVSNGTVQIYGSADSATISCTTTPPIWSTWASCDGSKS